MSEQQSNLLIRSGYLFVFGEEDETCIRALQQRDPGDVISVDKNQLALATYVGKRLFEILPGCHDLSGTG